MPAASWKAVREMRNTDRQQGCLSRAAQHVGGGSRSPVPAASWRLAHEMQNPRRKKRGALARSEGWNSVGLVERVSY